ncbi:cell division protein FtsZ [Candidatus Micrarchaeota archaeon]|nr:cell division protein FtsZ [Candidatus Micrarchaeota archaeon]
MDSFEQKIATRLGTASPQTAIVENGQPISKEDEELLKILEETMPAIYVVGTGGSGCNTINRMAEVGIYGAKLVAMNTDAQHLLKTKADRKLLIGKKRTRGLGAGSNPQVGEEAAVESQEEIKEILQSSDLVFVTCGMGGGTGTGSGHVIAKVAKELGALVVGVVTTPFTSEGKKRKENSSVGLEKLRRVADTTIAIPNDKLLYYVPDLPLNAAFKASDMVLTNSVKGITELVTKPGLVNLDFADLRTILERSGAAMIGLGEVQANETQDRVLQAAEKALSSPLLDIDVREADRALVNISGGDDMTLGEAEAAINAISSRISPNSHVIWGATIDESLQNKSVRVLAVLAGVKQLEAQEGEQDIGLDFVE